MRRKNHQLRPRRSRGGRWRRQVVIASEGPKGGGNKQRFRDRRWGRAAAWRAVAAGDGVGSGWRVVLAERKQSQGRSHARSRAPRHKKTRTPPRERDGALSRGTKPLAASFTDAARQCSPPSTELTAPRAAALRHPASPRAHLDHDVGALVRHGEELLDEMLSAENKGEGRRQCSGGGFIGDPPGRPSGEGWAPTRTPQRVLSGAGCQCSNVRSAAVGVAASARWRHR